MGGSSRKPPDPSRARGSGKAHISDIYQDMLMDALAASPNSFPAEDRPLKRRKVPTRVTKPSGAGTALGASSVLFGSGSGLKGERTPITTPDDAGEWRQPLLRSSQVDAQSAPDSECSDVEWEDVEIRKPQGEDKAVDIVLHGPKNRKQPLAEPRRNAPTALERRARVDFHKLHVLCLLAHVEIRNSWCNSPKIWNILKSLLPDGVVSYLNPDAKLNQQQRARSLMEGLQSANQTWQVKFKVTARGLRASDPMDGNQSVQNFHPPHRADPALVKEGFVQRAIDLEGSRDIGAQLYCALMRSIGVTARLVCSLQVVPLNISVKGASLPAVAPSLVLEPNSKPNQENSGLNKGGSEDFSSLLELNTTNTKPATPLNVGSSRTIKTAPLPKFAKRLWEPEAKEIPKLYFAKPLKSRPKESPHPIYWVEVFDTSLQEWIAVDPLVTRSVSRHTKFEPPSRDRMNNMTYVVAFEQDGSAKDVTRRYAQAYNTKTRKSRVESTDGGEIWWQKTMALFKKPWNTDRDLAEDIELAKREAQEALPKALQDYKNHPHYVLERYLRKDEVLFPKKEVGKVVLGSAHSSSAKAHESVYRRQDVKRVRSADRWYRLGRDIKPGEQALSCNQLRQTTAIPLAEELELISDEDSSGKALYAEFQTTLYEAPPIVHGRVPKNSFGNIDIFVPSMIPKGGSHVSFPEAARAARLLGIDFANAVTGFDFKGRQSSAVVSGIIVAAEYREAVEAVVEAFRDEQARVEELKKSLLCLRLWRRFLAGLRIRERIDGYEIKGEQLEADMHNKDGSEVDMDVDVDKYEGGGFFPER
ncbi:MAG: hypothetical protein M1829_006033 [Trizodia sp. TS-e1964]|nr:MAG: hypothetical protein M1829_006033 [Trizodia sp. TS-e1964]